MSNKPTSLNMAEFEKNFCKIPFEIFAELEERKAMGAKNPEKEKSRPVSRILYPDLHRDSPYHLSETFVTKGL